MKDLQILPILVQLIAKDAAYLEIQPSASW